jgi:hypothetical protein
MLEIVTNGIINSDTFLVVPSIINDNEKPHYSIEV